MSVQSGTTLELGMEKGAPVAIFRLPERSLLTMTVVETVDG
jgi:hypothetical protein